MPWLKRGVNELIPSVIWQPKKQVGITLQEMPSDAIILDIGAGGRVIAPHVAGVDLAPLPNTRVAADIHHVRSTKTRRLLNSA